MASASLCCEYLHNSKRDFAEYSALLDKFYSKKQSFAIYRLYQMMIKSRICVSTASCSISGSELAEALRNKFGIEPEAAYLEHVILISTVADTKENLDALSTALTEIDSFLTPAKPKSLQKPPCDGKVHKITLPKEFEATALENCIGKICAEFIYAYPPDIPLITPNDEITADFFKSL
ncbi:MAG: hypothetical protein L6V88_03415 [Anaerotruncus sp.]|nr:MAG: hypothetical protein L6V88_03415 [Anaerotruncus sp.]